MLPLTVLLFFAMPPSPVLTAHVEPDYSTTTLKAYAVQVAEAHEIDVEMFVKTMDCESRWIWNATSTTDDVGVVQINKNAHPNITEEQMLDPYWSLDWAAEQWADGNDRWWVCRNRLYW